MEVRAQEGELDDTRWQLRVKVNVLCVIYTYYYNLYNKDEKLQSIEGEKYKIIQDCRKKKAELKEVKKSITEMQLKIEEVRQWISLGCRACVVKSTF